MPAGEALGLIGLGLLGGALAERFAASGFNVVGFDLDEDRQHAPGGPWRYAGGLPPRRRPGLSADRVVAAGGQRCAVRRRAVCCRPWKRGLSSLTRPPAILKPCRPPPRPLPPRSVLYLDATVGGSSEQARQRDVIVMVGGDHSACNACRDIFDAFARDVYYVGPSGCGAQTKLVVNLVLGLNRAVLAEGLAFARSVGLDAAVTLEILKAGPSASKAMETKGGKMIAEDFQPQARLSQHLKDVRLILDAGGRSGAQLPFSRLHREILERLEQAGYGDADNSAVIKAF